MKSSWLPETKLSSGSQRRIAGGHGHTGRDAGAASEVMIKRLDDALRNLGDRSALNRNPLARLNHVQQLAAERYSDKILPRGLALRHVITECVARICADVGKEPGLEGACRYLQMRASGLKCREISSELGLAREHVSRTVRRRAIELLVEEFLNMVDGGGKRLRLPH